MFISRNLLHKDPLYIYTFNLPPIASHLPRITTKIYLSGLCVMAIPTINFHQATIIGICNVATNISLIMYLDQLTSTPKCDRNLHLSAVIYPKYTLFLYLSTSHNNQTILSYKIPHDSVSNVWHNPLMSSRKKKRASYPV